MRKILMLLALLMLLWPASALAQSTTTTVMVYMCGSNLESQYGQATKDIFEMLDSGFSARRTNVVLMTGGASEWLLPNIEPGGSAIHQLRGSSPMTLWSGDAINMGDSATLTFFLDQALERFQTERYILILWDHGGGPVHGVCWDENFSRDSLTIPEMVEGIRESGFAGRKIDMIGFDACLMSSVETAWQLAPYADWMVASEETEPGEGWNYAFLRGIEQDAAVPDTARRIIDLYAGDAADGRNRTLACIDLTQIGAVTQEMDGFFQELSDGLTVETFQEMSALRRMAQSYGRDARAEQPTDADLVDMGSLLDALGRYAPEKGDRVRAALETAVVYQRSADAGSSGLSIYFPYYNEPWYLESCEAYERIGFCPGYVQYIQAFQRCMRGGWLSSWEGLTPVVEQGADGLSVRLSLTEQQRQNLVSAKLVVFQNGSLPGSADAEYRRVYGSADVTGDETLQAAYRDERLVVEYETDSGLMPVSGAIAFQILDSGEYQVEVLAANLHADYLADASDDEPGVSHRMRLTLSAPDDGGRMTLTDVMTFDSVTGVYTSRAADALENYRYLHFLGGERLISREDGLISAYDLWQEAVEHRSVYTVPTDSRWRFCIVRQPEEIRYAAFEITDAQNNIFTTELTPVRPLEDMTLFRQTFRLEGMGLELRCRVVAVSRFEAMLLVGVYNQSGTPYAFSIRDVYLNGAWLEDMDPACRSVPAQSHSSWSCLLSPDMEELDMGRANRISFSLDLFTGEDGDYLGSLEQVTISPRIDMNLLSMFFK